MIFLSELIAVPEIDNDEKMGRYEYIKGYSQPVRELIVPKLQEMIRQLTGTDFVLFKDKCNAKNPGAAHSIRIRILSHTISSNRLIMSLPQSS